MRLPEQALQPGQIILRQRRSQDGGDIVPHMVGASGAEEHTVDAGFVTAESVPRAGESTAVAFPASYRRKPGDLLPPGDSQTPGVLTQGGSQWLPVLGCFRLAHNGLSQMKGGLSQDMGGLSQERGLPTLLTKDFTLEEASRHSSRSPWFAQFADFSTFYSADGTVLNTMVYHLEKPYGQPCRSDHACGHSYAVSLAGCEKNYSSQSGE